MMSSFGRLRRGLVVALLVVVTSLAWSATASAQVPITDVEMIVIVRGPTRTSAGSKDIVAIVDNVGTSSVDVCDSDISWDISVNGQTTTGSVLSNPDCKILDPGAFGRFRFTWTYGIGELAVGDAVRYTATISAPNDFNASNNSDSELRIAK
jgi:hypothetical protein